ncbi:MAG TPA: 50S ribosomal protein L28 [Patescibacteria group bacterium]|nr:50S ribosomal protein L28 [Patescibacteria group bacterium]
MCAFCQKGIQRGHNVSHAKNRTKKIWVPNLHSARVIVDGRVKRLSLCTKCLRTAAKPTVTMNQAQAK